jgi:hypothetical protein
MDNSQLRTLSSDAGLTNFGSCLSHWWVSMQSIGLNHDLDQQINYVTAAAYALVCRSKSRQDVYRDAFLAPRRVKQATTSLPDEDRERIRDIVRSRDRERVRQELDAVLERFQPPMKVLPALEEAYRRWVGKGVVLWRRHGPEGLKQYLGELEYWLQKYRKRGGQRSVRHFVNLFAYAAKACFATCFANAWIDIIPWLREHHGLDLVSERFLRFWNFRNEGVEIPHGRTAGGIYYPTHIRSDFVVADSGGKPTSRVITIPTERIGPTYLPDVFSGQLLSLHPLSGFLMKDPALCEVAGRLFASERYEELLANGLAEYWDLVGAILTAANLYRRAADEQNNERGIRRHGGDAVAGVGGADDDASTATLLEEFAAAQNLTCPDCKKPVRLVRYHPADDDGRFRLEYACRICGRPVEATFDEDTLEDWLRPGP